MILVDTHVVVWLALDPARVSKKARTAIEKARLEGEGLAISDITLLEIASLERKGRVQLNTTLETFLSEVEALFDVLPMTARICSRLSELPGRYPKDPADRVIGATALVHGIPLVTADDDIRDSKTVQTIW